MSRERSVRLEWLGEGSRFRGGGVDPPSPEVVIDGDHGGGPSPMQALLLAAGACAGADIVPILQKMRAELQSLVITVAGRRREATPHRFETVRYHFMASGRGLDHAALRRAVELSIGKYCSVIHTLAPDVDVAYDVQVG